MTIQNRQYLHMVRGQDVQEGRHRHADVFGDLSKVPPEFSAGFDPKPSRLGSQGPEWDQLDRLSLEAKRVLAMALNLRQRKVKRVALSDRDTAYADKRKHNLRSFSAERIDDAIAFLRNQRLDGADYDGAQEIFYMKPIPPIREEKESEEEAPISEALTTRMSDGDSIVKAESDWNRSTRTQAGQTYYDILKKGDELKEDLRKFDVRPYFERIQEFADPILIANDLKLLRMKAQGNRRSATYDTKRELEDMAKGISAIKTVVHDIYEDLEDQINETLHIRMKRLVHDYLYEVDEWAKNNLNPRAYREVMGDGPTQKVIEFGPQRKYKFE